jgi:hypothetical protein
MMLDDKSGWKLRAFHVTEDEIRVLILPFAIAIEVRLRLPAPGYGQLILVKKVWKLI